MSCRSQKNSLTQTTGSRTNEQTQHTEQTNTDISRTADCRTEDRSVSSEDTEQTTQVTDWSAPDSLGRQYPVRTTTTHTTKRHGQRNEVQTTVNTGQTATRQTATETVRTRDEDTKVKTDSKEQTRTNTPSWVIWTILGIIAALTVIVLLLLKHYRI